MTFYSNVKTNNNKRDTKTNSILLTISGGPHKLVQHLPHLIGGRHFNDRLGLLGSVASTGLYFPPWMRRKIIVMNELKKKKCVGHKKL